MRALMRETESEAPRMKSRLLTESERDEVGDPWLWWMGWDMDGMGWDRGEGGLPLSQHVDARIASPAEY